MARITDRSPIVSLLVLLCACATASAAPAAAPAPAHPLSIAVRSAPLGTVVAQMSAAAEARMRVSAALADQRVTLFAARTDVQEFAHALATLLGHRWRDAGTEERPARVLERDPAFAARVRSLQRRRDTRFLRRLLETADGLATGDAEAVAGRVRATYRQRYPRIDATVLQDIHADFLRQALLVTPLTPALQEQLIRAGSISIPFAVLDSAHQQLLARFADRGGLRHALGLQPGSGDVTLPYSRVTYRLLYGDRWTDDVLWIQVGAPGSWATAMLPSILFREEDGSALYPHAKQPPDDPDVWRRTPGRFDVAGKSWDRILSELSAAMNLKIAADASLRPALFEPRMGSEPVAGIPLRFALDRLTQERGLFWWKEGDWYYFRSRTWPSEERAAVPERLLRAWTRNIREDGALTESDLDQMGSLSEEQLLTLDLMARALAQPAPRLSVFDPDNASLAALSLLIFRTLTLVQRDQALSPAGLPALWMSPAQQALYSAVAAEQGYLLLPEEAAAWGFAVDQEWDAPEAGRPAVGRVRLRWSFGPGLVLETELHVSDALLRSAGAAPPTRRE